MYHSQEQEPRFRGLGIRLREHAKAHYPLATAMVEGRLR
jgi:hypothetical protein